MTESSDVNNAAAEATELASVGKTEAEIELANGETVGDRLGDTPVDGVVQDRNGVGEKLSEAASTIVQPPPAIVEPQPAAAVVLEAAHVSRLHVLVDELETVTGLHWAIAEIRSLLHRP